MVGKWKVKSKLAAMKKFWNDEDGIGTLEILLIIAVIIIIFFAFKDFIVEYVNKLVNKGKSELDPFTG